MSILTDAEALLNVTVTQFVIGVVRFSCFTAAVDSREGGALSAGLGCWVHSLCTRTLWLCFREVAVGWCITRSEVTAIEKVARGAGEQARTSCA